MRIGICLNMLSQQQDGTGSDHIDTVRGAGFDYLELPLAEMTAMDEESFGLLVRRVEQSGIRCECCNNLFPKTMRLTGQEADEQTIRAHLEKSLKRAAALGVSYVVFGSGPAKTVPQGFSMEEGYRQVVSVARMAADTASQYDIGVVMEPLRREESNLINTYEEGCRLARDAGRDNAFALVDYYHLSQVDEPVEHLLREGEFLRHVHFARNQGRVFPMNLEEEPESYSRFAETLRAIGYDGRVSLEAYSKDICAEAPVALAFMRSLFSGNIN